MSERMYRAQILLAPDQRRKLEELARQQGRSISAVTRDMIDAGLEMYTSEAAIWKKRIRLLEDLKAMRERQPFVYTGNLIEEARQERESEMDQLWRSNS